MRIIDLTLPFFNGMITYPRPWHPTFSVTPLGRLEQEGRNTCCIVVGSHHGTHVDAPRHFWAQGACIEGVPLDQLCGPARVLDLTDLPDNTPITETLLEQRLGQTWPQRLLLRFDWDLRHLGSKEYFYNAPYLTEGAAHALVRQGVRLIGVDSGTPEEHRHGPATPDKDHPVHKILFPHGIVFVESLGNLRAIETQECLFMALPMLAQGADGAPARCVAVLNL